MPGSVIEFPHGDWAELHGGQLRRFVVNRLASVLDSSRDSGPVAIALLDVDHFHDIAGEGLTSLGAELLDSLQQLIQHRLPDVECIRYGLDEFICIWLGVGLEEMFRDSDALRSAIQETPFQLEKSGAELRLTVSIGLGEHEWGVRDEGDAKREAQELLSQAADAQHLAKERGRNRVQLPSRRKMILKANYYTPRQLERLSSLSQSTGRSEAELLREALEALLSTYSP